jgi:hypothetical protein
MVSWLFVVFIPLFLAVWFLSMHLIAWTGGWHELAGVYGAELPMELAHEWRNRQGRMRYGTGYNGCLNIAANAMGMQLSLWKIFRPGHPPLFIPWSDVTTAVERGTFTEFVRFSFRRAAPTLRLRRDLAEEILRTAGVTSAAWHTSQPPYFSS